MVNAYTRGAVEVRSWCSRGTLEVRSRYIHCTLVVRSRYARGAVEIRSWCGRGTLLVRSRYARGALPFASGSVRLVNFSTGDTVRGPGLPRRQHSGFKSHRLFIAIEQFVVDDCLNSVCRSITCQLNR